MLIPYDTGKMYFSYPIFLVGYADDLYGANLTTCSSSYSLGDMFCFGMGATGHGSQQIRRTGRCTINFLPPTNLSAMEFAGFHHGREKLQASRLAYQSTAAGPLLTDAFAALTLTIDNWTATHGFVTFTATITQRLVQDTAMQAGRFDVTALTPALFAGDEQQRIYRTLEPTVQSLGDFIDQAD